MLELKRLEIDPSFYTWNVILRKIVRLSNMPCRLDKCSQHLMQSDENFSTFVPIFR
ncbi:hypothetical protein DPMN_126175 [Dreissena polymorpha]|uniref:Uncharacterized protein n=1 Tax=Dreissena polymorpha TaxID=45954 RepID=A0A9D4GV84_DREPO|nr:hypothetical protein DPMN_126175 [Dreissena polymorpha]